MRKWLTSKAISYSHRMLCLGYLLGFWIHLWLWYLLELRIRPKILIWDELHCAKSVRIRSYSDPHFPAFALNEQRYFVSLRIQSECGKMRTRITADTFCAGLVYFNLFSFIYIQKTYVKYWYDIFQGRNEGTSSMF